MFEEMVDRVRTTVTELLFKMQVAREAAPEPVRRPAPAPLAAPQPRPAAAVSLSRGAAPERRPETARSGQKVGRNDPCYCGSGKKYKKCCLAKGS
jgi:preprotein translocase subunit SecA